MSLEALSGARSRDKIVLKTFEVFPFGLQILLSILITVVMFSGNLTAHVNHNSRVVNNHKVAAPNSR